MRFFHISDLHIGKQLYLYSLSENQRAVFSQILEQMKAYRPDALLIAGDIFDKSVPSAEAVTLFDRFLNDLADLTPSVPVLIISGNHDSAERLNYASAFLEKHQITVAASLPQQESDHIRRVTLTDPFGEVDVYLLPFLKPGYVRRLFPEEENLTYDRAVELILKREEIDFTRRNVLVSHQFYVTAGKEPETCQSESLVLSVGGLDWVDAAHIKDFDYAALGHIHSPQFVGKHENGQGRIRYCGTPLKYSVSEAGQEKSITMVELKEKGTEPVITLIPLTPLQNVRTEKGTLKEVLDRATEENCHDYLQVILTDEEELLHPKDQLLEHYDHLLEVRVDNARTREKLAGEQSAALFQNPFEAFAAFYQEMQNEPMSSQEASLMETVIHDAGEELE